MRKKDRRRQERERGYTGRTYPTLPDRLFLVTRKAKTDADQRRIRMKEPNPIPRMRADMIPPLFLCVGNNTTNRKGERENKYYLPFDFDLLLWLFFLFFQN